MSLILDALRKADSERERGSVPGLHAHPLPALPVEPAPRPRVKGWQWTAIGVAAGVVVAWYFLGRDVPTRELRSAPAQATAVSKDVPPGLPTSPAPTAPRAAAAPAAPASAAARDAAPSVAEPAPWPLRESRKPAPATKAATASDATATAPVTTTPAPRAAAVPAASAPAAAAPAAAPATASATPGGSVVAPPEARAVQGATAMAVEPAIISREQLPQHIRAALPPLAISGSIYSPNAPDRTLIVNGRLYRENQALTADLSLEQIRQKSAVLRFRGYRFEVLF